MLVHAAASCRLPIGALGALPLLACGASEPAAPGPGSAGGPRAVAELPAHLFDTGLYADPGTLRVAADALPFEPQYPLWSDGALKRRWIRIPAGTSIDASRPECWVFPVGTMLWKEFRFERRVETRTMEQVAPGEWRFASYLWNPEETEAVLAPERGARGAWVHGDGTPYDVPARADCRTCHQDRPHPVLGFTALQLSPDRDPLAPHAVAPPPGSVDLPSLVAGGWLTGLPREWLDAPPRIAARGPRERAVLGYLHSNCGSCHNRSGSLSNLGLALDYPLACAPESVPTTATCVDVPSQFRPAGPRPLLTRIVPGDPAASVLALRIGTRNPLVQMPPLATRVVDRLALELIEAWIREDLQASPRSRP